MAVQNFDTKLWEDLIVKRLRDYAENTVWVPTNEKYHKMWPDLHLKYPKMCKAMKLGSWQYKSPLIRAIEKSENKTVDFTTERQERHS